MDLELEVSIIESILGNACGEVSYSVTSDMYGWFGPKQTYVCRYKSGMWAAARDGDGDRHRFNSFKELIDFIKSAEGREALGLD